MLCESDGLTARQIEDAKLFMAAWQEGENWANGLKVGDTFLGASGEAKKRYTHKYEISAFTSAGYAFLRKIKALYVSDAGVITRLEKGAL